MRKYLIVLQVCIVAYEGRQWKKSGLALNMRLLKEHADFNTELHSLVSTGWL